MAFAAAGDGEDTFVVYLLQSMIDGTTLTLDGQDGTDHYVVWTHGSQSAAAFSYVVNVLDSGDPALGEDTLDIYGFNSGLNGVDPATQTPYPTDDVFLLRSGSFIPNESAARPSVYCGADPVTGICTNRPAYVALLHPTGVPAGEDVVQAVEQSGYAGLVERVNYDNAVNGRLAVYGLGGNDYFAADDNSAATTLDGGVGNDTFQIGQIFGMQRNQAYSGLAPSDYFPTVATTRGYLSRGNSEPLVAIGGSGDDTFTVYSNQAALRLEGDDGNDLFVVEAFALAEKAANGDLVMGPLFTGSVTVTTGTTASDCAQHQGTISCATISRAAGSFLADGFRVGQSLVLVGTGGADDNTAASSYVITAISVDGMTLTLDRVLPAASSFAQVSLSSGPLAQGTFTVTHTSATTATIQSASFANAGFGVGQTIALAGTGTESTTTSPASRT